MLVVRHAKYLGSFPASWCGEPAARAERVSEHLHLMKERGSAVPVLVVIALSGVKVCDPEDQSVRMSHALRRISYATCEAARALFAFVAREPRAAQALPANDSGARDPAEDNAHARQFCHAFQTDTPDQAEELNSLVGDAFRMAFASQLQPSAPLWSKELSGGECGMGVRAPDSLPGLTHHYPHCLSPAKCDIMGVSKLVNEPSPSSSEESGSPTEVSCYRRLGGALADRDRQPLMRRLGLGLGSGAGALLQPDDDDSTPLVADTPTTPTNLPLCLNGGYINEASEAEARTRESNREPPLPAPSCAPPAPPVPPPPLPAAPRRALHDTDTDIDFRKCNNIKNCSSGACSRTTSSSSGGSSCGGMSHCSGNNNPRLEPELKQAPWFQQGIPREIALEVLATQAVGAFLVRGSTTQPACYALSVRVPRDFQPSGIAHYLILRTPKGYKIKGFTKEFTSLCALVTHHSVMPELLPVPLRLPRAAPRARDHADIDSVSPAGRPLAHAHAHSLANANVRLAQARTLPGAPGPGPGPSPPGGSPASHHSTPRRAHAHHHMPNFLTQLDV